MDYKRIALAAVVAWVVDSAYGVIVWMKLLGGEFAKYPALFRAEADMNAHMPLAFAPCEQPNPAVSISARRSAPRSSRLHPGFSTAE